MTSPEIVSSAWGSVQVAGHGSVKDAKCWPGGARAWDWRETGTGHEPGVQFVDVEELLDHGARVVVLSRGRQDRLQVPEDTVAAVRKAGADVEVLSTAAAIDRYNELVGQGAAVGALIHSTC